MLGASNFHHTHKHHKKVYKLKSEYQKYNTTSSFNNTSSSYNNTSSSDNNTSSSYNNTSSSDNNTSSSYNNTSSSDNNSKFIDDESLGVGVKLLDNLDEINMPIIYEKEAMFEQGNNTWNDYL